MTPRRPRRALRPVGAALLAAVATVAAPGAGRAASPERGPLAGAPAVMRARLWHKGRVTIDVPRLTMTLADTYERNVLPGFGITWFPLEWLGVGGDVAYGIPWATDLRDQVDRELSQKQRALCPPDALPPGYASRADCLAAVGIAPGVDTSSIQFFVAPHVTFVPIRGKVLWGRGAVSHYDFHVVAGAAYAHIRGGGSLPNDDSFGPFAAVGFRLFFGRLVSVSLQVRDFALAYRAATDQSGAQMGRVFHNHVALSLSMGLHFPSEVPLEGTAGSAAP